MAALRLAKLWAFPRLPPKHRNSHLHWASARLPHWLQSRRRASPTRESPRVGSRVPSLFPGSCLPSFRAPPIHRSQTPARTYAMRRLTRSKDDWSLKKGCTHVESSSKNWATSLAKGFFTLRSPDFCCANKRLPTSPLANAWPNAKGLARISSAGRLSSTGPPEHRSPQADLRRCDQRTMHPASCLAPLSMPPPGRR